MEPQLKNKAKCLRCEGIIENAPKVRRTRGKGRKTREQRLLEEEQSSKLADALNTDYFE